MAVAAVVPVWVAAWESAIVLALAVVPVVWACPLALTPLLLTSGKGDGRSPFPISDEGVETRAPALDPAQSQGELMPSIWIVS